MCQGHFEPALLTACQTALTCLPLTENEQRLSGLIKVTAQASNFKLCSTWPKLFQPRPK